MWCDVMWCDQQKSCDQSPVSPWVIFFLLQYAFKRTMQNNSTTHTWPSSMVCDLDMTAVFFLIPEPLAMSWWKSLKLWNTDFLMQHSLYTFKSAHNLLCWSLQWMKLYILAFTLSVIVCFRVYIRYKVVYLGFTSYIARLLPGLK